MRPRALFLLLLIFFGIAVLPVAAQKFKLEQLQKPAVKQAYVAVENRLKKEVLAKGLTSFSNHIYLRAFKNESIVEVWIKAPTAATYRLLKRYKLCTAPGEFGPKQLLGDKKVPEGLYHISNLASASREQMALLLDYPNQADQNRDAQKDRVYINSNCQKAAGNLSLSEEMLFEIYVLTMEAMSAGQQQVPVHVFPAYLSERNFNKLLGLYQNDKGLRGFWSSLKTAYDYFNRTRSLPQTMATADGHYLVGENQQSLLAQQNAVAKPVSPTPAPARQPASNKAKKTAVSQPAPAAATASTGGTAPAPATAGSKQQHTIAAGETLFSIAKRYGISLSELLDWNNMKQNSLILPGMQLQVSQPRYYTAKQGDTLYGIARKHGLSLEKFLELNDKTKKPTLLVGEKVTVAL